MASSLHSLFPWYLISMDVTNIILKFSQSQWLFKVIEEQSAWVIYKAQL